MDVICKMLKEELYYPLESSSYARKEIGEQIPLSMSRETLEDLYKKARKYACESIAGSLKVFENMKAGKIYHIYCGSAHFYILARVRTNYEKGTIKETARNREFLSFSILTERNLSHFPGRVIYGYQNISPSMIGYICHCDADTYAYAETRLELSEYPEELLDIEDLCAKALQEETYCQISVRSKVKLYKGPMVSESVLLPSVVIAIDMPTKDDFLAARLRRLPIVVLHRGPETIMNVYDMFFTPGLSNPTLI